MHEVLEGRHSVQLANCAFPTTHTWLALSGHLSGLFATQLNFFFAAHRDFSRYTTFGVDGTNDGTALAFSPDGSVIYIATVAEAVHALGSASATPDPHSWSAAVGDSNLCDIVVSPDGLSVRTHFFYNTKIQMHLVVQRLVRPILPRWDRWISRCWF